ncbi:MAG: RHS repeat-associated core domain-containing protein [Verrucomicrobiota bacterium]
MIVTTDARGNSTFYGYDAAGRSTAVTNALGQVSRNEYDASGNLTSTTDALGRATSYVYDALNRRVQVVFPDQSTQTTFYDALGRRVAETDQANITTWFGYDALGRLTSVTNALGHVTRYAYDELGQQVAQIDANQHTTTFAHDQLGRRIQRILPGGQVETYGYNTAGNLISKTDFNGFTTTYSYDALNRLLQKSPDARLLASGSSPVTFEYNALGERTAMTDASGVTTYAYDQRDRLIQKTIAWGGTSSTSSLNYAYDENGNVTSIQSSHLNGTDLRYEYDTLNRLSAVTDVHTGRTAYNYDAVGNLQSYTYPNNVNSSYEYDALNRLTNLAASTVLERLARYAYTVGPAGNRLSATETITVNAQPSTLNRLYNYDALYRLTGEQIAVGTLSTASVTYSYDPVGNRLARASNLNPILPATYGYDANDRLLTDAYDANGNTLWGSAPVPGAVGSVSPPTLSSAYDFENRLVSATTPSGVVTILYDGDGNRVSKTVNTEAATVTTVYLVDDLNPTGYPQVLEELITDHLSLVTATVIRCFTYGHDLISFTDHSALSQPPSTYFYGYDGHGSVRFLTDSLGQITDTYDYDAFGNLISRTGNTPNDYLYTGEQFDPDLGLYYLRARYHNPDTGRFWTMDSFEGFGGDPQSLHKYTYCGNDPVNAIDPSGSFTLTEVTHSAALGASIGSVLGGYDAYRRRGNIAQGIAFGAISGGVFGAIMGPIAPVFWTTASGQGLLGLFAALGVREAAINAGEGHYDLAAIQMVFSVAPLALTSSQLAILFQSHYASKSPAFKSWNQFQAGTKGQFSSRAEAAKAWEIYKQANGIATGSTRSQGARAQYLKSLVDDYRTPSWMKPWLREGRPPPGYEVDHIKPLSIGGEDIPANMRLQGADIHDIHHRHYDPWNW